MKYILIVIPILFFACTSNESPNESQTCEDIELVGKWELIEEFIDPGNGSGDFESITSDRVIEFFSDGMVTVNGELCFMENSLGEPSFGTYEVTSDQTADTTYDGEIIPNDCEFDTLVSFDLTANGNLILWYHCREACGQKFSKIN